MKSIFFCILFAILLCTSLVRLIAIRRNASEGSEAKVNTCLVIHVLSALFWLYALVHRLVHMEAVANCLGIEELPFWLDI